jgi:acyl carrier protein
MPDASLHASLVEIVRREGRVAPTVLVTAESRLVEDLGIDSLDLVAVFVAVQDAFDLTIDDADIPELRRVGDVARYVEGHRSARAA